MDIQYCFYCFKYSLGLVKDDLLCNFRLLNISGRTSVITAVAAGGHHGGLAGGGGGERGGGRPPICAGRSETAGKPKQGGAAGPGGRTWAGGVLALAGCTRHHRHRHLLLRHRPPRLLAPLQVTLVFYYTSYKYFYYSPAGDAGCGRRRAWTEASSAATPAATPTRRHSTPSATPIVRASR